MKKIDYMKAISGSFHHLLKNPEKHSSQRGITLITGSYLKDADTQERRAKIAEALVLWMGVIPESEFYSHLMVSMYNRKSWDRHKYWEARDKNIQSLLAQMGSLERTSENVYVRAVCRFMRLPNDVLRKWLWHENVDFQSCESFLRRLTAEQHQSLKHHYELFMRAKSEDEIKKLPCFTDGLLNKVWRIFNITAKPSERMETKSAFAHDFLGMGMGFKLYPSDRDDRSAPKELASQFLSKEDRGSFEVNKEQGGLYWFLFHTLRSNSLYRKNKRVELGRWVCPGFWFTMILWGIFLIVSPVSLVAGVALYALKGIASLTLFGLGAIFPIIFVLSWAKNIGGKAYDKDYWMNFVGVWSLLFLGHSIYWGITYAKDFLSFSVGILSLLLILPYCIKEETPRFWRAPVLGKVVPIVFLSALAFDLSVHSNFFEICWSALQSIAEVFTELMATIWGARYAILKAVLGVVCYGAIVAGLSFLNTWAPKKVNTMIEEEDNRVSLFGWGINLILIVSMMGVTYVFARVAQELYVSRSIWWVNGFAALGALPFIVFLSANFLFRRVDTLVWERVYAIVNSSIPRDFGKVFRKVISANIFWADAASSKRHAHELMEVLSLSSGGYDEGIRLVAELVRNVKDDEGLRNIKKFVSSEHYSKLRLKTSPNLIELILCGASDEEIGNEIRKEMEKQEAREMLERQKKSIDWDKYFERADAFASWIASLLKAFFSFITWPIRTLWNGAYDLYRLWEAFNEQCPQSPPSQRPTAQ